MTMTTTTTMTMMTVTTTMTTTTTERRRSRVGFRVRVLGFTSALLLGALVVGLLVQRAVLLERLDNDVDATLEQEREELGLLAGGVDPSTGQPFAGNVTAIFDTFIDRNVPVEGEVFLAFVDGEPYIKSPSPIALESDPQLRAEWANLESGERGQFDTDEGPVRYLAVPMKSGGETTGVFVIANFVQGERDEIESSIRVAAIVGAVVLLIAIAIAWVVAGRLLRPIRKVTATARSITDTDLGRRIPVEGDDEIAELAATFNQMLDRLQHAFSVQRAFVDDAGHELRTPITVVRGHLELMGDDPEERRETLALVSDELDRMTRIVDDLLLLAKAEQPDFLRRGPVEVSDLTTELLVKARTLGERAWSLDACAEGTVDVDAQRLTQAVLILARNAVDQTNAGDEVAIGSAWSAGALRLWVRDTGPGVDPADRERIFERFARGRGSRRRSEGAGLGLAIAHAIAVAHDGRIDVDSIPGQGAQFTIVVLARTGTEVDMSVSREEPSPWPAS
jgi:two-component system, OmpR family, sensor kinase